MKIGYNSTINLTITSQVENKDNLVDNPKEILDEEIKKILEDGIGEKVDIVIDSKFNIEE